MLFRLSSALALLATGISLVDGAPQARWYFPSEVNVLTATIQDLQAFLSNGTITSVQLTQRYLVRPLVSR
jgi:hypothetical protein